MARVWVESVGNWGQNAHSLWGGGGIGAFELRRDLLLLAVLYTSKGIQENLLNVLQPVRFLCFFHELSAEQYREITTHNLVSNNTQVIGFNGWLIMAPTHHDDGGRCMGKNSLKEMIRNWRKGVGG